MAHKLCSTVVIALTLCVAGRAAAKPQDTPAATGTPPAAEAPAQNAGSPQAPTAPAQPQAPADIRFSFKGATFQQVIDFFSRATGLPVIWETPAPEGTLDYVSPHGYQRAEALSVLNIILQSKGVMLRVDQNMLYLQKLSDMAKENIPTYVGKLPAEVPDDQIVTVVQPLKIALAKPIAEKLASMVASYGSVTAMEQQNSLVLTETAAQIRRLLSIIEPLDVEDPEGNVEIFPLKHASAVAIMKPLNALLSQRIEKFVINQQGQQVKLEENQMPGLSISADERTNSIIAKGVASKLDKLRETIQLLDVPAVGEGRTMSTFTLSRITPAEAAAKLNQLYQKTEEKLRPTVLALDDASKITIVGDEHAVREGSLLLNELDGGAESGNATDREAIIAVVSLQQAQPQAVIAAVGSLLNKRQIQATRLVPGPDGRSLIVAGQAADVDAVKAIIPVLDQQSGSDRQVRLVRITSGDVAAIVEQAQRLFDQQRKPDDAQMSLSVTLDRDGRVVTLLGTSRAVELFTTTLRQIESTVVIDRESKRISLTNVMPSELVAPLTSLAAQLLQPRAGETFIAPTFTAVDQLNTLVVTATTTQFAVIDPLIASLDIARDPGGTPPLRMLQLKIADAANIASVINAQYAQRSPAERKTRPVNVVAEPQTNTLLVTAHADVLQEIQTIVEELNKTERTDLEGREIRIFPLKVARAEELAKTIDEMFPQPPAPLDVRGRPQPQLQKPREVVVRSDPQTNSLIVDAPVQRMAGFEQLVQQLDRQQIMEETQVRTYQVTHANLESVASTIRQLASTRALDPSGQDQRVPITVTTEPISRALIVSGPSDIFARVDQVLKELDVKRTGPATELRFFKLTHARAESLAAMLREVLLARIDQDVPDAGSNVQALLNVTADRKTNTLIISAPEVIMPIAEQLIKQLDSGTAAAAGDPIVRVKPLTFADAGAVAQSISSAIPAVISKATGEPLNVRLVPSPGSNAIILVGLEPDLKEVEALIEPLDARPATDAMDARTFPLQHADAATAAPVVQRLLTDQQQTDPRIILERIRRSRGQVDTAPTIRVEADARTNSLIVSGPMQTVALAETLITQLDVPDDTSGNTHAVYTPRNADPAVLSQTVKRVIDSTRPSGKRSTLELIPEPQSGAILVIGSSDEAGRAVELLKQRDSEALAPPQIDLRIVSLQHSQAAMVAQAVTSLLADRTRWPEQLRAIARAGIPFSQPAVIADAASNRLLVSAPLELMPVATQLITELDRPRSEGDAVDVRIFTLTQASAADVATAVRTALDARAAAHPGEPRPSVSAEPSSNSLIVTATAEQLSEIEQIIAPLDKAAGIGIDQAQVRTVFLKHARAENVAPLISQLLSSEEIPIWIKFEAINRNRTLPETGPQVRVAADARLNAVVIAAPAAVLNVAEQMVQQLDVDPTAVASAGGRSVRVLTVHNADAQQLAANLQAIFSEPDQLDTAPTIRVDAASNSLLVRATDDQFQTIQQVVNSIDKATIASTRQMRTVPIDPSKADAAEIARTLQQLLDRSGGSNVEVITVDELLKRKSGAAVKDKASAVHPRDSASEPLPAAHLAPPHRIAAVICSSLFAAMPQGAPGSVPPAEPDEDEEGEVTIAVDPQSNSLILLGSQRAIERLTALAKQVQDQIPAAPGTIRYISLSDAMNAQAVAQVINQTLEKLTPAAGQPGDMRTRVSVIADPATNALIIAANDTDFETVADLIAALSSPSADDLPVRTIVLQHAQASAVATAVQRFYDDRAKISGAGRNRREQSRRISILGVDSSNSLLVAANDEDFQQIRDLVAQFDTAEEAAGLTFRVFQLRNARATEIERTVQRLVDDLLWSDNDFTFYWQPRSGEQQRKRDSIAVRADARLNALIVTGRGDRFEVVEKMVEVLDAAPPDAAQRIVRMYRPQHIGLNSLADVLRDAFSRNRQRRPWEAPDPDEITIRVDEAANVVLVAAAATQQEEIARLVKGLDEQAAPSAIEASSPARVQTPVVLPVKYARATELAGTLNRFLTDRARAVNAPRPGATIIASESANTLIVGAPEAELNTVRDLLAQLDQPDVTGDRTIEIIALQEGDAQEIARIVREQFGKRGPGSEGRAASTIVTADARTNSLIINAPQQEFAHAKALIERLDSPRASEETVIRTYALTGARADEAVRILTATLQLDAQGRTPGKGISIKLEEGDAPAVEVKAKVVADRRSNSLIVTATEDSFPVIESLISKLEEVPAASPVEWRIITLKNALAADVSFTLGQVTRAMETSDEPRPRIDYNRLENQLVIAATADQFKQIEQIIEQIDQPSQLERTTDFVPLKFAEAEKVREALSVFYGPYAVEADSPAKRNVRIVADPATNSLVISADKDQWEGIRSLLAKLDNEEYVASLQLKVLPLLHADAQSVARAINEAFQGQVGGDRPVQAAQGSQPGAEGQRAEAAAPTVLVQNEDWVRAAAEPQTNSVIISASRQNMEKIQKIITELDVADYAKLPPPRIIPVTMGDAVQLAQSLTQLYQQARTGAQRDSGRKALRIVGNPASNSVIVRAEEEDFQQIKALAEALQQQASTNGLTVSVLKLTSAPAARIATAITEAFQAKAKQANQPLSIRVDPQGNSLVVASTGGLLEEIKSVIAQLDAMNPGGTNQGVFIIDLQNIPPSTAKTVIETIGLDKPQSPDSVSRIVSEPIKVSLLTGRNAIVIVANPADKQLIIDLLKAIDAEPALADAQMRVFPLKHAQAGAVAQILAQILNPQNQQAQTALARAVAEQVRRLAVKNGDKEFKLDLSKPVRIVADPALNAVVVSSTTENIAAIEHLVAMLDQLPLTDAVTVQMFPLENIAAEQFARIVRELFAQGKQMGTQAVTNIVGMPEGPIGKALLDPIAISTDDRTNTVVVAGTEDAVALVEVLTKRLDSDVASGWVEPRIVPLRYADADELATTLDSILVQGLTNLPQSTPLQRQIGRLRMARMSPDGNGGAVLESDVFSPMTRLVIKAEPKANSLILIGTPANIEIVSELIALLDVEAASPTDTVRIYPIQNASASRLAPTIKQLFDQQVQSKAIRPEDRVIIQADERTNALVVATSPRSFAVVEGLLKTLDSKLAPELREIRQIEIKNASAPRLASLIQQMMDARLERLRKVQPESADLERATIVSDPRTNSLVVAAGNDTFEVIKRLAADLDVSTISDASAVQVLPIEGGNVERLAQTVNQIMERRYADMPAELRNSQKPLVLIDSRSNSLLVTANPEDLASIQDLVTKLAAAPLNPAIGIHIVPVGAGVRAELIAPRVQRLMAERQQSLGAANTPSDKVTIEADMASNSLIVAASDENIQIVRGLIEVLIQADAGAGSGGKEVELVTLASSRAADIVDMLGDLYVQEANRIRGANTVRVTADERLNAVLISAPASDIRSLKSLIAQLDGAKPASVVEIKYVPLQSANALETVSLIENVLSGRGIGARRGSRQSTVLKYLREIARDVDGAPEEPEDPNAPAPPDGEEEPPVEMEVSAAIRESITLTPDLRTNTIIVSAPKESITMIERMIRDLDSSSTGSKNIRIFKLTNADAVAMAEILTELFKLRQGSNLYVLKPREDQLQVGGNFAPPAAGPSLPDGTTPAAPASGGTDFLGGGVSGTELTAVPDERQQLSITVDSRTNSLIVSGTPTYLDLVAKVVEELDSLEANEREVYVYQLRNAVAEEVARVVSSFVEQEQQKLVGTLSADQLGSAARLLEREVTIQGDEKSNTVLVSASPRYMDRMKEMIESLDVDPPQVLIQVMLAEVSLDGRDEWGVDMEVRAEVDGTDISAGYGLASAFVPGLGLPNIAIAAGDFDLLIRALKSRGRLQVLSNPSIMAASNATARIQVGETLRLPTSTTISDAGRTSSTIDKEDVGVILEVTPSINPDGFVRMDIHPEISSLSARTTQISEDFQSPVITRRTADTTVTVHDGQTIVLGGLISDRFERRDRMVPLLGEIPVLGALFRSESEETAKTELLIVLTPHVIGSPTEFARVKQVTDHEIDRLSIPEEVKQRIRKNLLDGSGALYDAEGKKIDVQLEEQLKRPDEDQE